MANTKFFVLCVNAGVWSAFLLWMFKAPRSGTDDVPHIAPLTAAPTPPPCRITIVVYPGDVRGPRPNDRKDRLETIHTTWGSKVRTAVLGVEVVYVPDLVTPARDEGLPSEGFFLNISTSNPMAHGKFGVYRRVIEAVAERDPDFVLFIHDHTWVIVENLVSYVKALTPASMTMSGNLLKMVLDEPKHWFVSESAGMLVTRAVMRYFAGEWSHGRCLPPTQWHRDNPGHMVIGCYLSSGNVFSDSREYPGAHERFNVYGPVRSIRKNFDSWYVKYKNESSGSNISCCAERPISFHYVEYAEAKYWDSLVHGGRSLTHVGDPLLMETFPTELGGYSQKPNGASDDVFKYIIERVRI